MHQAYSRALCNHSKAAFDSFKRQERVVISCGDQDVINTCGQANLIRWAIRHEVLEHMQDHLSAVKADLRQSTHKEAKQKAEQSAQLSAGPTAGSHSIANSRQPCTNKCNTATGKATWPAKLPCRQLGVGFALTMLASLWLCLADPTLCHASLVDRNKHVFLAGRLALV